MKQTMNKQMFLNVPSNLTTKGEIAEYLYGDNSEIESYDCAVPLHWVHQARERGFDNAARHTVTCYYKDRSMRIMPVTDHGLEMLCTLATYL